MAISTALGGEGDGGFTTSVEEGDAAAVAVSTRRLAGRIMDGVRLTVHANDWTLMRLIWGGDGVTSAEGDAAPVATPVDVHANDDDGAMMFQWQQILNGIC